MFSKLRETPVSQAVLSDDIQTLKQLGRYRDQVIAKNDLGYNGLELAQYLGKERHVKLLQAPNLRTIKVINSDGELLELNEQSFEAFFGVKYLSHLRFADYSLFQKVLGSCSWVLKSDFLASEIIDLGKRYSEERLGDYFCDVTIQWIDILLGYGLFANRDIKQNEYIGEYTGIVNQISGFKNDDNTYSVNYPRMPWSINRFCIDAKKAGNESRFINHSYEPNVVLKMAVDRDLIHPLFFSNRIIPKGTQLTFDYGKDYWKKREEPSKI